MPVPRPSLSLAPGLALALALGTGQARAQGSDDQGSAAILSLDVNGGAAAQITSRVQELVAQKLQTEGMSTIPRDQVIRALDKRTDLVDCTTPECLDDIGLLVGADRFVRLSVEAMGATYTFDVELLYPGGGEPVRTQDSCAVCTVDEASEQIAEAVRELATRPVDTGEPAEIAVAIATEPPGATLTVDGKPLGVSPYRGPLPPGQHTVTASLQGYHQAQTTISVAAETAGPQRFDLTLVAESGGSNTSARPFATLKWVGAGATLASVGAGILWLSIDGNGTCSGSETCPEVYNTGTQGAITLGLGLAVGAVTGWMFWRDHQAAHSSSAVVAPTPGGAVGALTWTF